MKVNPNDYECDICKAQGKWNSNWSWYGSYEDLEAGKRIYTFCSQKCQNEFAKVWDGENIRQILIES